jgi:hypothetical protein
MANVLQKQDHGMALQRRGQHGTVLCIDRIFTFFWTLENNSISFFVIILSM